MTVDTERSHPGEPLRFCVETADGHPTDEPEWLTLPEILSVYPAQRSAAVDELRLLAPGEFYYDRDVGRTFTRPKRVHAVIAFDIDCVDERDVAEAVLGGLAERLSHAKSAMDLACVTIVEVKS